MRQDGVLGCRHWDRAGAQRCCSPCRRSAASGLLHCCGCSALATCTLSGTCRECGCWKEGLGLHLTKKKTCTPQGPQRERAHSHVLRGNALNRNRFAQPRVSQQHEGAQPISSTCTAALPAPKPSPARLLLAALQDSGLTLPHPKALSYIHFSFNDSCCSALNLDVKDAVYTRADVAETPGASCTAWVPLVQSCAALHAKWMLCSSFHSAAASRHSTGSTNPKANQAHKHRGHEPSPPPQRALGLPSAQQLLPGECSQAENRAQNRHGVSLKPHLRAELQSGEKGVTHQQRLLHRWVNAFL